MEAIITAVIKFGDTYFKDDDIVKILTHDGRTYVGRIVYYANNDFTSYVKLDTSERFKQSYVDVSTSNIVSIEYGIEHYNRNVECL